MAVLDTVLGGGRYPDPAYEARRAGAFVVAADCGSPAGTCFCVSMGTGPAAVGGYDLALTELADAQGTAVRGARRHRCGGRKSPPSSTADPRPTPTPRRAQPSSKPPAAGWAGPSTPTGFPPCWPRRWSMPRWDDVAERCLACGNCTLVCPTCFCSSVDDVTDLTGTVERQRRWASCFEPDHSYLHGGAVRESTRSRYRQWLTHKLGTWHEQFGTSGCVGCGRCITWCPVGIDITEEVAALRAGAGRVVATPGAAMTGGTTTGAGS